MVATAFQCAEEQRNQTLNFVTFPSLSLSLTIPFMFSSVSPEGKRGHCVSILCEWQCVTLI